jgi:DNA polymerase elongation subunit (family B)
MYKKCYQGNKLGSNSFEIHLWESDGKHQVIPYLNEAYQICDDVDCEYTGLGGESLKKIKKWYFSRNEKYSHNNTPDLYFSDMGIIQKFLVEHYGTNDEPSTGHKELFFDIECEIGGALTPEYIERAPMTITSIAWWDKSKDHWAILILDKKKQLSHTKTGKNKNKEIIPVATEQELLLNFIEVFRDIDPDILVGYNSDYFDIPYLYYRICNVLGKDTADYLSPLNGMIDEPIKSKKYSKFFYGMDQSVKIAGVESLDYMRLHKKYSWKDEPSWKLDSIGEKYTGVGKVDYEGNLDQLFETDVHKFIEYNFRDVEILKLLDEKLQYIALTKNISHKGKHNYEDVYYNSITQDGAISAYLLSQGIVPPNKERNPRKKEGYAGGYLFCPKAGLYKYMFDEDLTSLYPSIIMSLNIGKETFMGRIIDVDDRNNRLGLNDLKEKDPDTELLFENAKGSQSRIPVKTLIGAIETKNLSVSANGAMFDTSRESTLSTVLNKWFQERVEYKGKMKEAYKAGDKEKGEYYHLMQYTMKILLNSLYGATALPSFRYGMNYSILSEAITLSGHRIIQESALAANRHMNKVIRNEIKLDV